MAEEALPDRATAVRRASIIGAISGALVLFATAIPGLAVLALIFGAVIGAAGAALQLYAWHFQKPLVGRFSMILPICGIAIPLSSRFLVMVEAMSVSMLIWSIVLL